MSTTRKQMNVRLPPALIARGDERRAALGLSRDRYIEQLLEADLTEAPTPEPAADPAAEAAELAARIRGEG